MSELHCSPLKKGWTTVSNKRRYERKHQKINEGKLSNYKKTLITFLVLVPLWSNYADVSRLRNTSKLMHLRKDINR